MFSQQTQNIAEEQLFQKFQSQNKCRSNNYQQNNIVLQNFKSSQFFQLQSPCSKNKFDIKKFQHNILKQVLSKNRKITHKQKQPESSSKKKQSLSSRKYQQNYNKFKQIKDRRKLSRSKSKSRKDLQFKKIIQQKEILYKSHLSNTKILRQKLLSNLKQFDDYQMINIQSSIPILNHANILKILTSLEQTKSKIQDKNLPEGRIKQQAKFIYFLWKMINEEYITTKHLKQIILLLNQLNRNDLLDTLSSLYNGEGQIIKMLVECWFRLKMDKFYYQKNINKEKQQKIRSNEKVATISSSNNKLQKTIKMKDAQKTLKKVERCKTQVYETQNNFAPQQPNQQNFKNIKFLHRQQQKKLIQRLYQQKKDQLNKRQRLKTQNDQQKQNKQIKKCTFKPSLTTSLSKKSLSAKHNLTLKQKNVNVNSNQQQKKNQENSITSSGYNSLEKNNSILKGLQRKNSSLSKGLLQRTNSFQVKGFQKAVTRMKVGHNQTKIKQQLLNYLPKGQNYQKIKQKPINPPKFLTRQNPKKQQLILFVIQFEIGRHKVKVKIHPTDTQMSVSKKIAKIYGLKSDQQQEIRQIVSMELNNYYKNIAESVSQFIQG